MRLKSQILSSVALAAFFVTATPALANDAEVAALRAELAELKAQLSALTAKVEESSKPTKTAAAPEVKWKGAPEISGEGGWTFKPRGRIQYDVASVNAPNSIVNDGTGFSNEIRRARLGVEGTVPGGFGYKFELAFEDGDSNFTDAVLTYNDGGLGITVGQHNTFQGLEELTSSNDTSFIERAAFTDGFGFIRRAGVSAQYVAGEFMGQAGVFSDNLGALTNDGNNAIGFDGRAVYMPKIGSAQAHFGASYHWRDLGDTVTTARYRQRPFVHPSDIRFIDTGNLTAAKSETSYGLEAAIISGRFHAAAEGHWLKLNRVGFADPTFFGGSIEAGIFLTDDTRVYKEGIFKSIKVKNPVNKGGFGALQFNVRYDHLDLADAGLVGGIQDSYQASLIWTPIDYVRFMLNYGKLDYDQASLLAAGSGDYNVDVFGGRFQVSF